ncbi:hypothetical protein ACOCEA_17985, partial [Maribacter sp. CXY002]|uniref:hypothetical protein n=1 Tax=Maribacter luteocoastalis TaxID=3407671 RepID=UPI003B67A4F4
MRKPNLIILFVLLYSFAGCSQNLECKDFKKGNFYIPNKMDDLNEFTVSFKDSVYQFMPEIDSTITRTVQVRSENTQIEWANGIDQGKPKYELIEWIDDCTYRLKYDESNQELDETEKWINDNNGIVVSKIRIENNCMLFNAVLTSNEGQVISQKGLICKE